MHFRNGLPAFSQPQLFPLRRKLFWDGFRWYWTSLLISAEKGENVILQSTWSFCWHFRCLKRWFPGRKRRFPARIYLLPCNLSSSNRCCSPPAKCKYPALRDLSRLWSMVGVLQTSPRCFNFGIKSPKKKNHKNGILCVIEDDQNSKASPWQLPATNPNQNLSCPAVSQICSLLVFWPIFMIFAANSRPRKFQELVQKTRFADILVSYHDELGREALMVLSM